MGASIIVRTKTLSYEFTRLTLTLQVMQRLSVDHMPLPVSKNALSTSAAPNLVTADLLKNSAPGRIRMIQSIQRVTPNMVAVAMSTGLTVVVAA